MNLRRYGISVVVALSAFLVFTIMSASWGLPALYACVGVGLATAGLYFHYRRKQRVQDVTPVTPDRDDRVIPQNVKIFVAARDKGECQIRQPGICTGAGEVYDHVFPWSKGGSSKDPDNIQLACTACNAWKSDKVLV